MKERLKKADWRLVLSLFVAGALIIIFYFFAKNIASVGAFIGKLIDILMPFILGFAMAYLVCPIYNGVVRGCYRFFEKRTSIKSFALSTAKVFGSIVSLLVIIAVISAFIALLAPQIFKSILAVVNVLPDRMDDLQAWIVKTLAQHGRTDLASHVDSTMNKAESYILTYLEKTFLPGTGNLFSRLTSGIVSTIGVFFDVLIGLIACVYFLNGKERFAATLKREISAHAKPETAKKIYDFGNYTNKTFGGFISGKILDSIIIGIICYVVMTLLKLPYVALISTIVGVTNIIPFFGPFIGAIPSAIIICVHSPIQALEFLIMVFLLQQFDGNILGPKILGGRVGISSFWVMFSIILGGGLFGVLGMLFAVPVFAALSYYLDRHSGILLVRKGLPPEIDDYISYEKYGIHDKSVVEKKKKKRETKSWTDRNVGDAARNFGKTVSETTQSARDVAESLHRPDDLGELTPAQKEAEKRVKEVEERMFEEIGPENAAQEKTDSSGKPAGQESHEED